MSQNLFLDKSAPPTAAAIAKALGPRARYLDDLERLIPAPCTDVSMA